MILKVSGLLLVGLLLSSCGENASAQTEVPLGVLKEVYSFQRSGEPTMVYNVVHVSPAKASSAVVVVNTQVGVNTGTNYTRQLVNCEKGQRMVLGSSETYEGLEKSKPDMRWSGLVRGSSAYFVAQKACAVVGRNFGA
jgi:hypothetical protein